MPNKLAWINFKQIMYKFLPCLVGVGIIEFNLLIDSTFASVLPSGSITVLGISSKFMQIALSSFAVAFSSISLSHFSSIITYAPKRLNYYILESVKFIFWVTIPVTLIMSFFSYDIFYTLFYQFSSGFSLSQVGEASSLLIAFVLGLFFYSINKLLLSVYYSMGQVFLPTVVSLSGAAVNIIFNWLFVCRYGSLGLAIATTLSAIGQTLLLVLILDKFFKFKIYYKPFLNFVGHYLLQLFFIGSLFYLSYKFIIMFIVKYLQFMDNFLLNQIGLWFWVGPLTLLIFGLVYSSRKLFKVKIYYLD